MAFELAYILNMTESPTFAALTSLHVPVDFALAAPDQQLADLVLTASSPALQQI